MLCIRDGGVEKFLDSVVHFTFALFSLAMEESLDFE